MKNGYSIIDGEENIFHKNNIASLPKSKTTKRNKYKRIKSFATNKKTNLEFKGEYLQNKEYKNKNKHKKINNDISISSLNETEKEKIEI